MFLFSKIERKIADFFLKPYVSDESEFTILNLINKNEKNDEKNENKEEEIFMKKNINFNHYIIIGCDGLWDKVKDKEAAKIVINNPIAFSLGVGIDVNDNIKKHTIIVGYIIQYN